MQASFAGGPTYISATSYAPGNYLYNAPEVEARLNEIVFGSAPGVDGSYSIDFGFREQGITLTVLYVATTYDEVFDLWVNDSATLTGPVDFTAGGKTFKRCFVEPKGTHNGDIQKMFAVTGQAFQGTVYFMFATIKVSSKGTAQ